jgi:hypothetical protein
MRPSKSSSFWPLVALIATLLFIAATQIATVKCLVSVTRLAGSDMRLSEPDGRASKANPADDLLLASCYASEIARPCGD